LLNYGLDRSFAQAQSSEVAKDQSQSITPQVTATVYSFTETRKAFHPFFVDRIPYLVVVVELEEQPGLRVVSNLVGVAEPDVRFGMPVTVGFEQLAPDLTIPVFSPATGVTP